MFGYVRIVAIVGFSIILFLSAQSVVPNFMLAQHDAINASAMRHGIQPDILGAILYNEMLGKEQSVVNTIIPGNNRVSQAVRQSLLGWHFLTLKRIQWALKGGLALLGSNTTIGLTGIRVSVGREIQQEELVTGGRYRSYGLGERLSMVRDLMDTPTAIEYLAANLQRGAERAPLGHDSDWQVLARWHNTGVTADSPIVPKSVWDKGTNYVARVQAYLPEVSVMLAEPPPTAGRTAKGGRDDFQMSVAKSAIVRAQ